MRKLILAGIISVLAVSMAGCFEKGEDKENNTKIESIDEGNENESTNKNDSANNNKDTQKKEEETSNKGDIKDKNPPKKEEVKKKEDKTERVFKITTLNVDEKVEEGENIKTVGLGVADNLSKILETVSAKYFDKKHITLKTIETVGDKKIAVVNLGGDKNYWINRMQGSTGGRITSYTLIENVLQKSYKGYWINGVKFTLDGKPLQDTGHTPDLAKVTYR